MTTPTPVPENADDFVGVPDAFERLWTPHRMAYISGEAKPVDNSEHACPFCRAPGLDDAEALIVHRGQHAYAVLNLFPYSPGHVLICPYRHIADWTEASAAEREEIGTLAAVAMAVLREVSAPDGFNLGINQGAVAGAGIAAHLHQHVVPRWAGDSNFLPVIAQTRAIPQLLGQTQELLSRAWRAHFDRSLG